METVCCSRCRHGATIRAGVREGRSLIQLRSGLLNRYGVGGQVRRRRWRRRRQVGVPAALLSTLCSGLREWSGLVVIGQSSEESVEAARFLASSIWKMGCKRLSHLFRGALT